MSKQNYLNSILTVNAILLGVLVWMGFTTNPNVQSAQAAEDPALASNVPNASAQRAQMIKALGDLKRSTEANQNLLSSGKLRVEVTNLDDIDFPSQ